MTTTTTPTSGAADLRTAAQAVIDRWDTPLWKDVPATAEYIGRLRAALAAGQATAAQAVVQDDLITIRKPTTSAELLWLLKLAHLVISDVDKALEETFAPAQPAAQQGVAYAALPDEREMLKHALWLASSFTVHRYMMSCAEGRWSGAEKATCHDELCRLYVAVFRGVEVDQVRVDLEADWMAVHDATQELTDHMDVVIGFPLKGVPDYKALAPKFFAYFHRLATHALRASHGQAPAGAAQADSVPAVSDLPPLPAPDLRDVGTKPQEIKEFLKGYATEYARTAIAARAPADSGQEDAARKQGEKQ